MPQAVTHVLITIILVDLYRDYLMPGRRRLPLDFVLLGGIAGLLPDIDIPIYWLLNSMLGLPVPWFHRTITHSIFFPLIFLLIAVFFHFRKTHHSHKWAVVFGIISAGITIHLLLDMFLSGGVSPFYPLWGYTYTAGIFGSITLPAFWAGLDAILLLAWLYHEERKHKIRDFI